MADERLGRVLRRLAAWGEARGWVGADPYEGLNAPLARVAPGKRGRQAVVQLYKRAPFPPPWPLRAPPQPNSKTLGLVVSGYATRAGSALPGSPVREPLISQLRDMRIPGARGVAWGYHFDLQTRHLFYEASSPNAVATAFAAGGLLDEYERAGDWDLARMALQARPFLVSLLRRNGSGAYFAYVAKGSRLVHNANLLVCGLLARLHELAPSGEATESVLAALPATLRAQDERGLWPYGDSAGLEWADNFHTAYILENLVHTDRTFGVGGEALRTGIDAWRAAFFDTEGGARYEPKPGSHLEAHSFASAIDLCCVARALPGDWLGFGNRVAGRAVDLLWMEDEGRFAHRVSRRWRNEREFMRWTNAPMFRALARLLSER